MGEREAVERRRLALRAELAELDRQLEAGGGAGAIRVADVGQLVASLGIDLVTVHAMDGRYLFASPAASRLFGHEPAALIGRGAYELFHPEDAERVATHHQTMSTAATSTIRYRLACADGSYRWCDTRSQVSELPDGTEVIVAVTRDVQAEVDASVRADAAEAALVRANSLAIVGRLAGALGHELSGPLMAATVGVEFILSTADLDDSGRSALRDASHGLQRADEVLGELRLLGSVVPSGDGEVLVLDDCVRRIVQLVGPWEHVEFETSLERVTVRADVARAYQLLFQLLLAHSVGRESRSVTVSLRRVDGWAEIEIGSADRDHGRVMRADIVGMLRGDQLLLAPADRLRQQLAEDLGAELIADEVEGRKRSRLRWPASRLLPA